MGVYPGASRKRTLSSGQHSLLVRSHYGSGNGSWISSHIMNQDFIAWVGQGTVSDRSLEHLGASDRGISMMRRRFLKDLEWWRAAMTPRESCAIAKPIYE